MLQHLTMLKGALDCTQRIGSCDFTITLQCTISDSAVHFGAAEDCKYNVDDDQNYSCKSSPPAYFGPPHFLFQLPCISLEGKGLALQVICFVNKQLNPFSSFQDLQTT